MKRGLFFRSAASIFVMLIAANVSFAQILTNYVQVTADPTYQTAGTDVRFYALPDPVYSPSFDAATNTGLGTTARWAWTYAGLTGAPTSGTAAAQNYVEFTNVSVGVFSIVVAESNTLAGCTGADVTHELRVVAAPTAAITTADPGQACGNQLAMAVNMTFTEAVPQALAGYAFAIREVVDNIDPADAVLSTVSTNNAFVDFPTSGKLNTGNDLTGAASPYGYSFNTSALAVQNNLRTRYTYTLLKATDAPGPAADGIISAISQKSDFLGSLQTYAFGDNQIVIIVNPAPVTGPIYHIPNNFAY